MKWGKDEKGMGPLFPRLHLKDTEKGRGPRAPPRNKMALYEQLTIPSQRFNGRGQGGPRSPHQTNSLLPSLSSSQGDGHEKSVFSPFVAPPTIDPHCTQKFHPCSPEGVNLNNISELETKVMTNSSYKPSNLKGHFLQTSEHGLSSPQDLSAERNSCQKKISDEDDFQVPTLLLHPGTPPHGLDKDLHTYHSSYPSHTTAGAVKSHQISGRITCNFSIPRQNFPDKPRKWANATDINLNQNGRNQIEDKPREAKTIKDSSSHPSIGENISGHSNCAQLSLDQERPRDMANVFENLSRKSSQLLYEEENGERGNVSTMRSELGSRASLGNSPRSCNEGEICSTGSEDNANGSPQVGDGERNDDSETSVVDTILGLEISTDDVVDLIGQKHFWKARRAIVNQQRVFTLQVFELHRLIKVQKLIAGSPHMLLEDDPHLRWPMISHKRLPPPEVLIKPRQAIKNKNDLQNPSSTMECSSDNSTGNPPIPSVNFNINNAFIGPNSCYGPYSANAVPTLTGQYDKASPWHFPPNGNQWLVPVMSLSEGLVYKPYTGLCPPNGSFMAPVFGGCDPIIRPPVAIDYMGAPAYGVLPHYQQPRIAAGTPHCFPHYGLPVMNPTMSASAPEQVNAMPRGHPPHVPPATQRSGEDANFPSHSRSLNNSSNQKSEGLPSCAKNIPSSVDDVQGRRSSGLSCEHTQGGQHAAEMKDRLHGSPVSPVVESSTWSTPTHLISQRTHVIKVVPHNRRSANKSAARIFQAIQKERQQHEWQ